MAPYGYPDWSRIVNAAGDLKDTFSGHINTSREGPVFPAYDHQTVTISMNCQSVANHYFVQIFWANDAAGDLSVVTSSFTTMPVSEISMSFPVLGPFAWITVTNVEATADATLQYWAYSTDAAFSDTLATMPGQPLIFFSGNVSASSTEELDSASVYRGPAHLFVSQGNNDLWNANYDFWDHASKAWITMHVFHGAQYGQDISAPIRVPPAPVRLVLSNLDTVTRLMHGTILT